MKALYRNSGHAIMAQELDCINEIILWVTGLNPLLMLAFPLV